MKVVEAVKVTPVAVRKALPGEEVITWSVAVDGYPVIEKVAVAKKEDFVVKKIDRKGKVAVDINGHSNRWLIDKNELEEKYEPLSASLWRPKRIKQKFLRVDGDFSINGEKIVGGGWVNIENLSQAYGISDKDFSDTYEIVEES